ncbi:hypothetical protein SVAN01_03119 [Stagonosporopsis vannaccii]|nr:hypothetical protein SVAN01_03119 [Stagonosporopsis vannaccii]
MPKEKIFHVFGPHPQIAGSGNRSRATTLEIELRPKIVSHTRANGIARRQLKCTAWTANRSRRLLVALRGGLACGAV